MENPIKSLRKQHQLTQQDLGVLLGLAAMQISQYERGALRPSEKVLGQIAAIFGINKESLRSEIDKYYQARKQQLLRKLAVI